MALGSHQKLAAICGSITAIGGALAIQHFVKQRQSTKLTSATSPSNSGQQVTRQRSAGLLDLAIKESRLVLDKLQHDTGCPGISVTVSLNGKTVWKEGFGFSDLENSVKCSPDSVMKIASVSKPITMTLVGKEWEAGKLDLDADIRQYVPYWPEKYWAGEKVILTPRQLSSHLGGIRDYKRRASSNVTGSSTAAQDDFEEYYITKKYKNVKQSLDIFKDDPLVCKPGTEFHYTTHGFTLLAAALEGATKKKFTLLLSDMLKELGLSNTYIEDNEKITYNLSRHYVKGEGGSIQNAPFTETSFKIAGAGLLSTTDDLAKFGNMLLYSFQRKTEPFGYLKPTTVEMFWTPRPNTTVSWDTKGSYGLGWQIVSGRKGRYVGHTGGTVGASSALVMSVSAKDPEGATPQGATPQGVVVAILCNLQGVALGSLAVRIGDKFLQYS